MDAESVNSVLGKLYPRLINWLSGNPENLKKEMADLSPFVIKQALSMPHNFHEFPKYYAVLQALSVIRGRTCHKGENWLHLFTSYMGSDIEDLLPEHAYYYMQGLLNSTICSNLRLVHYFDNLLKANKNRKAKGVMKSDESASFAALLFFLNRTSKGKWSTGQLVRLIKRKLPKLFYSVEKAKGVQDAMKDLLAIGENTAFESLLFLSKEPLTKKNLDQDVFLIPSLFPLSLHLARCCNVNDKQSIALIDSYYSKRINGLMKFNWSSILQTTRKNLFKDDKDKINITVHMFHLLEVREKAPYHSWYDMLQHYVDKYPQFLVWGRSKLKLLELEKIKNIRFTINKREANYNPSFEEAKELDKDGPGFLFLSSVGKIWWTRNGKFYLVEFHNKPHLYKINSQNYDKKSPIHYNPNAFILHYESLQSRNFFGFVELLLHYQNSSHQLVVVAGPFDKETSVDIRRESVLWPLMPNFYSHINKEINNFVDKFPTLNNKR